MLLYLCLKLLPVGSIDSLQVLAYDIILPSRDVSLDIVIRMQKKHNSMD